MTGVAFVDFNSNGVREAQEVVLPGVQATLTGTTSQGVAVNASAVTDASGAFSILNVQPGTYQLSYAPIPGLLSGPAGGDITASEGITLVSQLPVTGGQLVSEDIGFGGLTPEAISLRQFLSFTTTGDVLQPAGSGLGVASSRENDAPVVRTTANLLVTGVNNGADSIVDLAGVFSDPNTTNSRVTFKTSAGPITIELFDNVAPKTVANFFNYVVSNRYDNAIFHRLGAFLHSPSTVRDVLQAGLLEFTGTGTQGQLTQITIDPTVGDEVSLPNTAGTIAMAKTGAPNSATSQFFFNLINNTTPLSSPPQANGGFTVFGKIDPASQSVLNALANFNVQNKSTFNGALTNLPLRAGAGVTNFPTSTVASDYALISDVVVDRRDEVLTYSIVSNSNPSLLTASITDNRLRVDYQPGQTGTATITIRATDIFGATKDAPFTVTVS